MMIVLIVLAAYGISFLLQVLLDRVVDEYWEDPDVFYESISEDAYYWSVCPIVSMFVYMWFIHKAMRNYE